MAAKTQKQTNKNKPPGNLIWIEEKKRSSPETVKFLLQSEGGAGVAQVTSMRKARSGVPG